MRAAVRPAVLILPLLALAAQAEAATGPTAREVAAQQERRLMARDADGDGRVSRSEFLAGAEQAKGDPARRFAALDRNGDGALDRAEIAVAAARRFARLDKDGDGRLSPTERAGRRRPPGTPPAS